MKIRLSILCVLALVVLLPARADAATPAPSGLTAIALDGRVDLAWQAVATASAYTVYRGTSPTNVTTPLISTVLTPPDLTPPTRFTDTTALNGTTYYYAVRATAGGTDSPSSLLAQATPVQRSCVYGNPVTLENCFPGGRGWDLGSNGSGIEGFATATSIDRGGSVGLKVNSAAKFDVEIWRSGWYGGDGGRLISILRDVPPSPQPACVTDSGTGATDCSNWSVSQTLTSTSAWPSGVYLLHLVRRDTNADNSILLVVRNDARSSDVLYGVPFTTYQAYNNWGGKSLYGFNSSTTQTVSGSSRAVKVSFDRPFAQVRDNNIFDWYTRSDSAWVSWLERSGYDVTYTSTSDLERSGSQLLGHRVYLSGAHDEYWSAAMRAAVQSARDSGANLLFGGANESYWKIRFEPSAVSGAQDRIEVCYKTAEGGPVDPSGISTTTWRDVSGPNQPENALAGQMYIGDNSTTSFPMDVSAAQGKDRMWRFTGLENQATGTSTRIGTALFGWEWDARKANGAEPAGVTTLATANVNGNIYQDATKSYITGAATAMTTKYTAPSGALVFSAGTNRWDWGLGNTLAGTGQADARIQQATTNLLSDMAALPETPMAGMRFDDPASAPLVTRRTPSSGADGIGTAVVVRAAFSRAMDPSTITPATFTLKTSGGTTVPASISYDGATFVASLTPSAPLANDATYTARLDPAIKAANGIALGSAVSWGFTTASPDHNPPGVAITSPISGDTVVGSATVAASAGDDVAVDSVQFKVDGQDVGAADTQVPYSVVWDARGVAAGSHTLTAVARDTSGNSTTSDPVTVTVDPTGLVAAYGFEEPSGSTVGDSSGKGNTGTLTNVTRSTAGKFGSALSFNGTNSLVTIPDAPSLDVTTAMTAEAWVNPATLASWRTIMLKESPGDFSYALYGNVDGARPEAFVFTTAEHGTLGTGQVPTNAWTHLAMTYDGSTLRLFVNGSQVSSAAVPGPITASNGALRLGGNTVWGEWLNGRIDEVRIYKRALTASEIVSDMNTPVAPVTPDTQPPTAPTGLSATGSLGQAQLSWTASTDNVGVARYDVHRSSASGFTPSTANRIAQVSGTSFTDTSVQPGTWYYKVVAEDAAGNVSAPSAQAQATVTADTTPPTVSISSPTAGTTVGGSVTVSANASDNVAVASVQFKLDGADLGSPNSSAPYQVAWDTTTASAGSHTLTAVARDGAGNSATSAAIGVTVDNSSPPPPTGLVAAYGFEEASGTTVSDASGKGNSGTLSNAARTTAGKLGSALSFNGTNSLVTVPDSASLDLTTGMTLEAWVNPTASMGTSWRSAVLKERTNALSYALYANNDSSRPSGHVDPGTEVDTRGTAPVAAGTWTHLATTYDGTTLRLYVNGTQVSSKPATGSAIASTGALRIGGNNVWGEWFDGRIDEVRIYNRALGAAEIQTDMTTPVTPLTPDTQAPTAPTGLTATGSLGQAQLSWTASTDNVAVTRYEVYRSNTSGFTPSATNRIAQPTATSYTDTSVAAGTWYYKVAAVDGAGNVSAPSGQAQAIVTADTTPPTVSISSPSPGTTVGGSVTVSANASDNVAVASVQFKLDGADLGSPDSSAPYQVAWDTTTASAGSHTLTAVARDGAGNTATSASVSVTVDNTAPPVPPGLVAAYGFEEASGATATDSSGTGNVGTLTNATRTSAGKFGSALSFDGLSSLVTIPDSASLHLTTGMTLEAWVNPAAAMGTAWRTAVIKERTNALSYALYANTDSSRPSGHVNPGSEVDTRGTAQVAAGTWTHLAATYDGATLRLYVNGSQVSSRAVSGSIVTTTGALRIGGNNIWGEWFSGKIDDVRVYNRALGVTEIQGDMTRPAP